MDERCERGDHLWDGCTCERCLTTCHRIVRCRCEVCLDHFHDWNACTCQRCGERDEDRHKLEEGQCFCKGCNNIVHELEGLTCRRCGYELSYEEIVDWLRYHLSALGQHLYMDSMIRALESLDTSDAVRESLLTQNPGMAALLFAAVEELGQDALGDVYEIMGSLEERDERSGDSEEVKLERHFHLCLEVAKDFHVQTSRWGSDPEQPTETEPEPPDDWDRTFISEALSPPQETEKFIEEIYSRLVTTMMPFTRQRFQRDSGYGIFGEGLD